MKLTNLIFSLCVALICLTLSSCDGRKIKKATNTIGEFEQSYRSQDINAIAEAYPDFSSLYGSRYKIDQININEEKTIVKGDTVTIEATSSWTNTFGKEFKNKMTFILVPNKDEDKYIIINSKGLISLDEEKIYRYAVNKNAKIASMMDKEKSIATSGYLSEFYEKKSVIRDAIKNGLSISNLNWHTGGYYTDYAAGSAMVTNNYPLPLRNVKYKVSYYSKNPEQGGRLLAVDDGTVTFGDFLSGESRTFSFYTSNVGNAHWAYVECFVDNEDYIEEIAVLAGSF